MPSVLILYLVATLGAEPAKIDFNRDIQPIFKEHCYKCHGESSSKNGLRLHRKADALKGGDSGKACPRCPLKRVFYGCGVVDELRSGGVG